MRSVNKTKQLVLFRESQGQIMVDVLAEFNGDRLIAPSH